MSNKTNVVEELTFEEYWERYSCASDTPKMAARAAWILAIKQEKRLQEIRLTKRAPDVVRCVACQSTNAFEAVICVDCCAHTAPRR